MRYLFYYIWVALGYLHVKTTQLLMPINWLMLKLFKRTDSDFEVWKDRYNYANLEFPGGINDWFAFGTLITIFLIPIVVITTIYSIDIYTENNKWMFFSITGAITLFCYYWIYYRNIGWLKERIEKVNKKFYIK